MGTEIGSKQISTVEQNNIEEKGKGGKKGRWNRQDSGSMGTHSSATRSRAPGEECARAGQSSPASPHAVGRRNPGKLGALDAKLTGDEISEPRGEFAARNVA